MKKLFATSFVLLSAAVLQAEGAYSPAKAELKPVKGVPCVFVNDEMLPPMSFTGWWMHLMEDDYLSSFGRAGLRIHYIKCGGDCPHWVCKVMQFYWQTCVKRCKGCDAC